MLPDTDARHGTHAGYVAGCGQPCCQRGRYLADINRAQRRAAFGGPLTVDAARAQQHLEHLASWGVPYDATGVSHAGDIHRGDRPRILRTTEAAILATHPLPGVNCFPTWGAKRRLQGLVRLGHSQKDLADRLGVLPSYLSMLLHGTRGWRRISSPLWLSIEATYDDLSMKPGTSVRARGVGERNGWLPPMCWEEETIDSPDATPYTGTERGNYAAADLVEEWTHLRRCGVSLERAAKQLGVRPAAIEKALERVARRVA